MGTIVPRNPESDVALAAEPITTAALESASIVSTRSRG